MAYRLRLAVALSIGATLIAAPAPFLRAQAGAPPVHGMPTMSLFAVVYEAGPKWKAGAPMKDQELRDHFLYLRDLSEKGVVVVAGPLGADGGLVILRAPDQSAAAQAIAADPAVIAGVFVGKVKPFLPRIGGREPLNIANPDAK